MKPLLSKTTKPFLIYVLIILTISVPVYYVMIDSIWKHELDEHNKVIVTNTVHQLNELNLTESELDNSIQLWNKIKPDSNLEHLKPNDNGRDSIFTIEKEKTEIQTEAFDRFRCLSTVVYINQKPYRFTVETNIEETGETVGFIALITLFFFLLIVGGLLLLNRKLSNTVWEPFRNTLHQLKKFNLNTHSNISFEPTDTKEFDELNLAIRQLIDHNVKVYQSQKEFTENASHELQTPLAILKNKLDILLQSEDLTEKQYHIAEDMYAALNRSSRINKNLLLLTKIESHQFDSAEIVQFDGLLRQSLAFIKEHIDRKDIIIKTNINQNVSTKGNNALAELLINNLLINAMRYTITNGTIAVSLTAKEFRVTNSGTAALNSGLIFKRFARLSQEKSGSGLGLSIVEKVVRFHNWKIKYDFQGEQHVFTVQF